MKKYKHNYMFSVMFQLSTLVISLFPSFIFMWLILNPDEAEGALYIFPFYIVLIFLFIIFGNLIHYIISFFSKHTVFIDDDTITLKGKRILTQSLLLSDVKYVVFDKGAFSKYGGAACSIALHDSEFKQCLMINNPSFLLICQLQKRLSHATFKYNNYKFDIITGIIAAVTSIIISFIIR